MWRMIILLLTWGTVMTSGVFAGEPPPDAKFSELWLSDSVKILTVVTGKLDVYSGTTLDGQLVRVVVTASSDMRFTPGMELLVLHGRDPRVFATTAQVDADKYVGRSILFFLRIPPELTPNQLATSIFRADRYGLATYAMTMREWQGLRSEKTAIPDGYMQGDASLSAKRWDFPSRR